MAGQHVAEARSRILAILHKWRDLFRDKISDYVVVEDFDSRYHLLLRTEHAESIDKDRLAGELATALGIYWTGDLVVASSDDSAAADLFELASADATIINGAKILIRHVGYQEWFSDRLDLWTGVPHVVAFQSFKGGVGRTTALLAFAVNCMAKGQSIALIDFDLEAPGLLSLFNRLSTPTSRYGVVDYLVDRSDAEADIAEYVSIHSFPETTGECFLMHAGELGPAYIDKLSRVRLSDETASRQLSTLLLDIKRDLPVDWILVDSRSGLSGPAGLMTSGVAHLNVLVATNTEQNLEGLRLILNRIGRRRVAQELPQEDCLVVQSLVPRAREDFELSTERFTSRLGELFDSEYYVDPDDVPTEDAESLYADYWTVADAGGSDSPDTAIFVRSNPDLTQYSSLNSIVDDLIHDRDYGQLFARVSDRFVASEG